jgi:hypothetical protein
VYIKGGPPTKPVPVFCPRRLAPSHHVIAFLSTPDEAAAVLESRPPAATTVPRAAAAGDSQRRAALPRVRDMRVAHRTGAWNEPFR